ncbi:MAG: hypothetical protein PWQ25_1572, partial [Deferribacteres bacterium]|nr:hypothetical protein [Deferribacteres bacterium]
MPPKCCIMILTKKATITTKWRQFMIGEI